MTTTKPILIFGEVKDDNANPLSEARVSFVESPVPLTDIAALTDKGNFVLSAPTTGDYIIEVVLEGFVSKRVRVSTGTRLELRVTVQLSHVKVL